MFEKFLEINAYYSGRPAPMALALRQPRLIDIFAVCLIIWRICYGK